MLRLVKPLVLVGLPGAGKTTVGRILADRLGCSFADSDEAIEREAGQSISGIFAAEGEAGFRRRERATILRLLREERVVIALGGGSLGDEDVRRTALGAATLMWLCVPEDLLVERIATGGGRPLFVGQDVCATLRSLMERRAAHYAAAHHQVRGNNSQAIAAEILAILAHSDATAASARR
ncbi:MAG: shikimate kinase [Allosphingosinicella sp.]|uniref:shikimate kinase n=1 Tax=Allosphingosinicella sp. TaxID=2823234 RepID=UPI00393B015E